MRGILYGVGVGPGDPELMTLKAVKIIAECQVIAFPDSGQERSVAYEIAGKVCRGIEQKEQLKLEFPMTRDRKVLEQCRLTAAKQIVRLLETGKNVAFLTLGDPSIYSTYSYLHRLVREMGFSAEMVAGVPSFCAAAALLGDSLADAGQPLRIIPGSYGCVERELEGDGAKVLMKNGKALDSLKKLLVKKGVSDSSRVVINCGMEGEKVCSLEETGNRESYFSMVIVKETEK